MCRLKVGDWCDPSPSQRVEILNLAKELNIRVDPTTRENPTNEYFLALYPYLIFNALEYINGANQLDLASENTRRLATDKFISLMRLPALIRPKKRRRKRKAATADRVQLRGYMGAILRVLANGGRLYSPWDTGWYYLSNGGFGYSMPWNSVNALESAGLTVLVRDVGEDYYNITDAGRARAAELLASDAKKKTKEASS